MCSGSGVLQPLKLFSQNMQQAFLDPPFFGSVEFVTEKIAKHNVLLRLRFQGAEDPHQHRLHLPFS